MFIIQNELLRHCIKVDRSGLVLEDCSKRYTSMLWKWVNWQRLFNVGSNMCLGLDISNQDEPLGVFECDSSLYFLQWHCRNSTLSGASQYKLVSENGRVLASRQLYQTWKQYMSDSESLCEHPYQEIYTLRGNSLGMPCVFPFKYNNRWYHECIKDSRVEKFPWCSTTSHYDRDGKWGFCTNPEEGCNFFWEWSSEMPVCYQFNLVSSLSWSEARASCHAQGGDLLSITDLKEQNFVSERLGSKSVVVWTGLNQMDESAGWQWADGTPLALVNWKPNTTHGLLGEYHCGVFSSISQGYWQRFMCESGLPYVCKKYLNHTDRETFEEWKYYPTRCDTGWYPHNRNCYKFQKKEQSWDTALLSCHSNESELIRITSLAHVELIISLLKNENVTEVWTGLSSNSTPLFFRWSDGSAPTFTNWQKQEPNAVQHDGQLCVSVQASEGQWKMKKCEEKLFYICQKTGDLETFLPEGEKSCKEGWERHGEFCYHIDSMPRSFGHASSGYYCASSLLTVMNRFEQAFIKSMIQSMVKDEDAFLWIALQDPQRTGEYVWINSEGNNHSVSFTYWNKHQPSRAGGCVAMRGGNPAGRWEVKDCANFRAMSLCKKALQSSEENPPTGPGVETSGPCPLGWESEFHLPSCYKVFHHEKMLMTRTWEEAETLCQDFGAHLASFSHIYEEMFLSKLLTTMFHREEVRRFWIGFNRRNPQFDGSWEWSDGTPVQVVGAVLQDAYVEDNVRNCVAYTAEKTVLPLHCAAKLEWICKIPKGVKPKLPKWLVNDIPRYFFQGTDYFLYESNAEWAAFEFVCGWMRGNLMTIHSSTEQEFIHERIKKVSNGELNWWIGLIAENPNDEFHWRDGSPLTYQNWNNGQEKTQALQSARCAYISAQTGFWGEEDCLAAFPAICKSKHIIKLEKEIPQEKPHQGLCPKRWLYFGYKCFLVHMPEEHKEQVDWFSAYAYCRDHGAKLASVDNQVEQAFITMQLLDLKSSVWIRIKNYDNLNWDVGNPYSNWSPSIKVEKDHSDDDSFNKTDKTPLCPLMSNHHNFHVTGKWYLEDCHSEGHGFVCEKAQEQSSHTISTTDMYPVPDVLEYGNRTYRIINGNMTWYDALKTCKEIGTDLVSIADQYHQSFLTVIVDRLGYSHWIGLFSLNEGLKFEWADGTTSLFTFWADENTQSLGNCVYINTDGDWISGDCEMILQGAVCYEHPNRELFEFSGECPEADVPWIKFKSNCYSFSTVLNGTNFEGAHEFCKQQGSTLLSIKDEDENTFLLEELGNFVSSVHMVWLDIMLDIDNNVIAWFDGSSINYSNWGVKQPKLRDWTDDICAALKISDGLWQLSQCRENNGFICKTHTNANKKVNPNLFKASYHGIIPLAVSTVMMLVVATIVFCIWRQKYGLPCRTVSLKYVHYVLPDSGSPDMEGSVLISDLEASGEK
nr:secretory phospholipase A2 receptor isoform X2 [Geotrypetes seraphini]